MNVHNAFSYKCRLQAKLCPLKRSVEVLTPNTCECELIWKIVFTEVIKLNQANHTESRWALNPMASVHIRREKFRHRHNAM